MRVPDSTVCEGGLAQEQKIKGLTDGTSPCIPTAREAGQQGKVLARGKVCLLITNLGNALHRVQIAWVKRG